LVAVCLFATCASARNSWWNENWPHRIPVTVDSGMYERENYLVRLPLDLKKLARAAGVAGGIGPASLRVVEFSEEEGTVREIPSVFKKGRRATPAASEQGTLLWQMTGNTETLTERTYHVYFDRKGSGKERPAYPPIPGADETPGENLLPNGGFEDADDQGRPAGWQQVSRTAKTVGSGKATSKHPRTGKRSLHISKPTLDGDSHMLSYGGWKSPIEIKPNTKYRLTAWIKATGKGQQCVQLSFAAERWRPTSLNAYVMPCGIGAHDWKQVSAVATSPADARYAAIRIHLWKSQGDAYFDDVQLTEVPAQPPPRVTVSAPENRN